jgi:hypothetical protein
MSAASMLLLCQVLYGNSWGPLPVNTSLPSSSTDGPTLSSAFKPFDIPGTEQPAVLVIPKYLDFIPQRGSPSEEETGTEAMDPNGTRWKTVNGHWDLDHDYYRHNL